MLLFICSNIEQNPEILASDELVQVCTYVCMYMNIPNYCQLHHVLINDRTLPIVSVIS